MTTDTVQSPGHPGPFTAGLVGAELVKLGCSRTLGWVAALTVVVSAGIAFAMGHQDPAATGGEAAVAYLALFAGYSVLPYASAFLASSSVAAEFGSGVSRVVYAAVPARWPVIVAKAVVNTSVGAGLAVLGLTSAALVLLVSRPVPPQVWLTQPATWAAFAGAIASCSALALIGTAVGALCRRVQGAVVVLVALLLLAPPLLGSLAMSLPLAGDLAQALPITAANALVNDPSLGGVDVQGWPAAVSLALWAGCSIWWAIWTVRRVDL